MQININNSIKIQYIMAVASFVVGTILSAICLFIIPPIGEIAYSALSVVSEFLVLCGALLGVSLSFDVKLKKFESKIIKENNELNK